MVRKIKYIFSRHFVNYSIYYIIEMSRTILLFFVSICFLSLTPNLTALPVFALGTSVDIVLQNDILQSTISQGQDLKKINYALQLSFHLKALWGNYGAYAKVAINPYQYVIKGIQKKTYRITVGSDIAIPMAPILKFIISPGFIVLLNTENNTIKPTFGIAIPIGFRIIPTRRFHVGMYVQISEDDFASLRKDNFIGDFFDSIEINVEFSVLMGKLPSSFPVNSTKK